MVDSRDKMAPDQLARLEAFETTQKRAWRGVTQVLFDVWCVQLAIALFIAVAPSKRMAFQGGQVVVTRTRGWGLIANSLPIVGWLPITMGRRYDLYVEGLWRDGAFCNFRDSEFDVDVSEIILSVSANRCTIVVYDKELLSADFD